MFVGTVVALQETGANIQEEIEMGKRVIALCALLLSVSVAVAISARTLGDPSRAPKKQIGEVTSVDPANNQIVIKSDAGTEVTLIVSEATKITKEGKTVALADVKAGDQLTSECEESDSGCKAKQFR